MSELILLHNPRCSKSRAALELLEARGLQPQVVRYLETARQLLRTGEDEYKALGLDEPSLGEEAIIEAMARHPKLIERPVLVAGDKAVVGRPPERVLEILA